MGEPSQKSKKQKPKLEHLFYPKSVAVVGVSSRPRTTPGGRSFLETLLAFGYKGKIYPINPKGGEILGLKAYPDISSLPETPDYVISSLPGSMSVKIMKDCASKGVKAISMYTAGFSEAGDEGSRLEKKLVDTARKGGVHLIGPNCLGIYCPSSGISFSPHFSTKPGNVGLLCQSGGNSIELTFQGGHRGIYFSKVVSYGNAAELDEVDFLEYFSEDDETEIIMLYIEGVRRGKRFFDLLSQTTKNKPVIILKGGKTEAGISAAASHTGSLTGSKKIWDTLCHQAGAIQVYSFEEMLDVVAAFLYIEPPKGKNVGIVGVGGGVSVLAADDCESAGLRVPDIPSEVTRNVMEFTPKVGTSLRNPVDTSPGTFWNMEETFETIKAVASYSEIDFVLVHMAMVYMFFRERDETLERMRSIIEASEKIDKPLILALRSGDAHVTSELFFELQKMCLEGGMPVFTTIERAANAVSKLVEYNTRFAG